MIRPSTNRFGNMEEQRAHRRYPLRCRVALRGNDQQLIYGDSTDICSVARRC